MQAVFFGEQLVDYYRESKIKTLRQEDGISSLPLNHEKIGIVFRKKHLCTPSLRRSPSIFFEDLQ